MADELRAAVIEQARKIEEDCDRAAIRDALLSTRWNNINTGLGLSAAIIAAAAAVLAGTEWSVDGEDQVRKWTTAASALVASILASVLTFLTPSDKARAFQQYANKYHALRDRIRSFIAIRILEPDAKFDFIAEFDKLLQEKREIDADHPVLPEWVYNQAHKKIRDKRIRKRDIEKLNSEAGSPAKSKSGPTLPGQT